MRKPERLDSFYEELKRIHQEYLPDWRFGQMIFNFIVETGDLFYLEEDAFLEKFKEWLGNVLGKEIK